MRNIQTREGFEFWDKLNALPRYAFLLSPSGKSVQKFEDQAMGNWIDVHEAQKVVDQAQDEINQFRAERDALQQRLNAADQRFDELTSAVRSINHAKHHEVLLPGDDEPQYPQRKEWVNWILGLCDTTTTTERSNNDYAIEHAEYMAKSADDVLAKFQAYGLALLAVDEGGDDGEGELFEAIDSARQDLQVSLVDMRGMVYEFRKRSNRCTPQ